MKGELQAVLVPKKWPREKVQKFLERNKLKSELEEEGEFWCAVQLPSEDFKSHRLVKRARGVVFRLGYKDAEEPAPAAAASSVPWWDNPRLFGDLFK